MLHDLNSGPGRIDLDDLCLDEAIPLSRQVGQLKEDLLQVHYPCGWVLDVGWYPEFDPDGAFRLFVVRDRDWTRPVLDRQCRSVAELRTLIADGVAQIRERIAKPGDEAD